MLDLNLARAAKRSFCCHVGERIGKTGGQVPSQQIFKPLLCEAWEQGGSRLVPPSRGSPMRTDQGKRVAGSVRGKG